VLVYHFYRFIKTPNRASGGREAGSRSNLLSAESIDSPIRRFYRTPRVLPSGARRRR